MIFRRIREHFRTRNWSALGVDVAVVALVVALGFQIGNLSNRGSQLEQAYANAEQIDQSKNLTMDRELREAWIELIRQKESSRQAQLLLGQHLPRDVVVNELRKAYGRPPTIQGNYVWFGTMAFRFSDDGILEEVYEAAAEGVTRPRTQSIILAEPS